MLADKQVSFTEDNTGTIVELGTNPSTLAVDTDTLYVDSTNNRVGIGTSSPAESIHTTGNIRLGDSAPAELYSNSSELRFGVDKNNDNGTSNITFYVDDNEKMRIDSSGNMGIGTTSPSRELEVTGSGNVYVKVTAPTASDSAGIELANTGATWLIQNDDTSSEALTFDRAGTEAMRIDSSGKVGIGTSSPSNTLDVAGTIRYDGRLLTNSTTADGSAAAPSIVVGYDYDNGFFRPASNTIGFTTGGSERMRIDSSGNVGIGTASADEALEVSGDVKSSGGNFGIYHFGETSDVTKIVGRDGGHGSFPNTMDFFTNSTQRMRIDSSGNVGIGTSSPSKALTVGGTGLRVQSTASADFYSTAQDALIVNNGNANLRLWNNGAERMRIDSSGNVGIGTSSPASTLEIAKNDQTNGATLSITNSFNGGSWDAGDTVGSLDFRIDDSSTTEPVRGKIKVFDDSASGSTYPYASAMSFTTTLSNTSTERMRISSSGKVGIGTTSPAEELHVVGDIVATGNVTAYYSDEQLKDFQGTIPNALDKVAQLNGYYYTPNEEAKSLGVKDKGVEVGVSAQEVQAVLPEIVTDSVVGEGYKTVWYDKLTPLLIEAIKELKAEVEELKRTK